jgi:sugar phosphate isomerase/epimerase
MSADRSSSDGRPVTLFTGQWADLPLAELAAEASEWGFDGLELACWGDHFEIERALPEPDYVRRVHETLSDNGLDCWALGTHLISQAVCDPIDARHRAVLPPEVWGDGEPEGVRTRAAERIKDAARAAAAFSVQTVTGFTGSSIWHMLYSFPPNDFDEIGRGYEDFAQRWGPIIDVFDAEGVRFAREVHPTEIAYDFVTTRRALEALDWREGFGINLTERGWTFVSPGHGDVDFEALLRALNRIGYAGPLSIEWEDSGMDREYGARDALGFVRRSDFAPSSLAFDASFQSEPSA